MASSFHLLYVTNCAINGFSCYPAIMLNIFTIYAIQKTSSYSNKTLKTLLLSLAVSDLGVGLVVQPLYIAFLVLEMGHSSGNSNFNNTDNAFLLTANLFGFASFFGVVALSADRFLAIYLHLRYQELATYNRVVAVVMFVWVFSTSVSLARIFISVKIMYLMFAAIE